MSTQFNVNLNVSADELQDNAVLVFLKPQDPQRDYRVHAWQVLKGAAGTTVSFDYEETISTDVSVSDDGHRSHFLGHKSMQPGQLLSVVNPNGLAPQLELAATSQAQRILTPQQYGVVNKTNPYTQFDSNWYVSGRPVVTIPHVDAGLSVRFEYMPNFYFMVGTPPMIGQTYIVQDFSHMAQYMMPAKASSVDVVLGRHDGLWNFDFNTR